MTRKAAKWSVGAAAAAVAVAVAPAAARRLPRLPHHRPCPCPPLLPAVAAATTRTTTAAYLR